MGSYLKDGKDAKKLLIGLSLTAATGFSVDRAVVAFEKTVPDLLKKAHESQFVV